MAFYGVVVITFSGQMVWLSFFEFLVIAICIMKGKNNLVSEFRSFEVGVGDLVPRLYEGGGLCKM